MHGVAIALRKLIKKFSKNAEERIMYGRPNASKEGDGWLFVCVYRHLTDISDIVILDGKNIEMDPIATVHLPRRIPAGFH